MAGAWFHMAVASPRGVLTVAAAHGKGCRQFENTQLPLGESIVHPASRCPGCGYVLRWYDNIPVLSYVALGDKAKVVLDTGHHAPGTNIEFIVAQLLRVGRLGAFDFNSRFYADDDLMVGAADPFQLFRIMHEVVIGGGLEPGSGVVFMLDQCHNIEPKIPGQIRSVMNVQEATAKALLVDRDALAAAQQGGDVLGANAVLMDAYNTDVRPLLGNVREGMGMDADPMAAYARSGYADKIAAERVGGQQAGWGA